MKKLFLFINVLITFNLIMFSFNSLAQTPNWLWAKGAIAYPYSKSIAVDASGNSFITGNFNQTTATFGNITVNNIGGYDFFLAKYDISGNILWAKSGGGTSHDYTNSVAVDASGNTYVAGYFNSPTISIGSFTLTNFNPVNYDLFIAKYDVNGNVLWAKSAGGVGHDCAYSVAIDSYGNAYLAGNFQSNTITFGTITLTAITGGGGGYNTFIAIYSSNGNLLWAQNYNGSDGNPNYISIDGSGNIYMSGGYSTSFTIGSDTLIPVAFNEIFLEKFNSMGNVLWAKSVGGNGGDVINSIAVDNLGNCYLAGNYSGGSTIFFDSIFLTGMNNWDSFLVKYDASGNSLWAKGASGWNDECASSVIADVSGNCYIAGWFTTQTINFDSYTLTNCDNSGVMPDLFLAKYDAFGYVQWAIKVGGAGYFDEANSIAIDALGDIYMTGVSHSSVMFGSITLLPTNSHVFTAKLDANTLTDINNLNNDIKNSVFPNPACDHITIEILQQATIDIFSIQGQLIKTLEASSTKTNVDVSALASGVYYVRVKTEEGIAVKKFVKE